MRGPIVIVLTTFVFLAGASMALGEEPAPSITVIGSGAASGPPDTAEVNAGVVTQAATASQAMGQNSAAMACSRFTDGNWWRNSSRVPPPSR